MDTQTPKASLTHPLERALAVLAAAACLFITIAIWRSVSAIQPMWLLPGLYFVELSAVSILTAGAFLIGHRLSPRLAWIAAGIYAAFAFMGLFSVGLFYAPVALMFLLLAVLATSRRDLRFSAQLVFFLAAAVLQVAAMFVIIKLLYPGQ